MNPNRPLTPKIGGVTLPTQSSNPRPDLRKSPTPVRPPEDEIEVSEDAPDEEEISQQATALRTFDRYWIERKSVMHTSGFKKTYDSKLKRHSRTYKTASSIPLILRDMGPPKESVFDPRLVWEKERPFYLETLNTKGIATLAISSETPTKKKEKEKEKKVKEKKLSKSETIKLQNSKRMNQKVHVKDIEKMSNNNSLESLQAAKVDTDFGKLQRMLKMLHMSVLDLKQGKESASEEEVFDILWALQEMKTFREAEEGLMLEKVAKKAAKKDKATASKEVGNKEKKIKKSSSKGKGLDSMAPLPLSDTARSLKTLYDQTDFKDSLKHARKLLESKKDIVSFQMTNMHDRLPPLSKYNRKFKLENWQCRVLDAIDNSISTVVCAPTSSGKTLLSTYTCARVDPTSCVLFVLPSEVLVWQVAATYYQFFEGNVTLCTESIGFQDQGGKAQVYIGTPRALEIALTKARGIAGQEMVSGEREFMVLDGGFSFDYLVLDEVHTLNGPEGDALQRIIKCLTCPVLALSATIGNANQLRKWFQSIGDKREYGMITSDKAADGEHEVMLVEHFARFINLQRFVVSSPPNCDTPTYELTRLHPIAVMSPERTRNNPEVIDSLSMTPVDLMDCYKKLQETFPDEITEADSPRGFFGALAQGERVTLKMAKLYENRLKEILINVGRDFPERFEQFWISFKPPKLNTTPSSDVTPDQLYQTVDSLKKRSMLPAVAFQLSTMGAFKMFHSLLSSMEEAQNRQYPTYKADLIAKGQEKARLRKIAAGKAEKGNNKDAEEEAKAGFDEEDLSQVDVHQPHPSFVLSAVTSHLKLAEVEDVRNAMAKAGEPIEMHHALIRGLRRGLAIYTDEVGFACYRRQVQILAQKGRIAVVFSDEALAYGVNMPFRTCLFCGDMGDALTPLIAQQMQGRAGRRGMDVQGNIVYLGLGWEKIEELMIGKIDEVTGKEPRYPLMALQRALAASNDPDDANFIHGRSVDTSKMSPQEKEAHAKWSKMSSTFETSLLFMRKHQHCSPTINEATGSRLCGQTLQEFCEGKGTSSYEEKTEYVVEKLGFCHPDGGLAMDHNVVSMAWEIGVLWPSVAVGVVSCIDTLYTHFILNQRRSPDNIGDQNAFIAALLQIIDRCPAYEEVESLQSLLKVSNNEGSKKVVDDVGKELYEDIEEDLRLSYGKVLSLSVLDRSEVSSLALPLMDESVANGGLGPSLDGSLFSMLLTKRKGFNSGTPFHRRNELKGRLVRFGEILRRINNNIQQPHGKYRELFQYTNKCFSAVRYSTMDLMNQTSNDEGY